MFITQIWIGNKRVLILSDSVDRYMAVYFCQAIGLGGIFGSGGKHTTAWCIVSSLNLTIYHWHFASMFTVRPEWWWIREMTHVPWEIRYEEMYKQTLPEVVGMDDYKVELDTEEGGGFECRQLFWSALRFFIKRSITFVHFLKNIFPGTPLMYSTSNQHEESDETDLPLKLKGLGWGRMMAGFQDIYNDNMHVGLGAHSWTYGNMLTYYLFRASGGTELKGNITLWLSQRS
ncbi:hypothetical protein V1514DRAFT_348779 [Lipomyces japonicus]|uniref:uncharacterized protein n=1 Tax=Lipomyces japonicus TaxID=56871 RepID=UPI0034CE5F37